MGILDDIQNPNALGEFLSNTGPMPNYREGNGVTNRDKQVMTWMLPNATTIQMYINPESFVISESKQITPVRTKGGYVVQYWGDNLTKLSLTGTTGSSGVTGINVLRDVYRAENRIFESVAASQTNELIRAVSGAVNFADVQLGQDVLPYIADKLRSKNFILRPSLASLALGVTLFYQGVSYRGFFVGLTVTEDVSKLGLFSYAIEFTVTETYGTRDNFMAWHREAMANDPAAQALNAIMGSATNGVRGFLGLSPQQSTPPVMHPGSSPLSFGGSALASLAGVDATGL